MRLGLLSLICLTAVLQAASTPSAALLVLSKGDNALVIVDPSSRQLIASVPCGPDPHEVVASTDGKWAYVSNYGGGAYNTLSVVDLTAQQALPKIDLGALRGPHGLVYLADKVWFTAEGAKAIGSFDPATRKIDWILGTGQNRTHMIWVSADLRRIVTSNVSSATVSIIEKTMTGGGGPVPPHLDWNETVVPVGHGSEGFDVSPDGKQIWVANAQDGTVSVIDAASKNAVQTLDANVKSANRLKFTPDGKLAFVSALNGSDITVLDTATRAVTRRINIGHGAAGILMEPDGARAFVACTPDDYVAIIDLKSLAVTGHIGPIKHPDGLAWAVEH